MTTYTIECPACLAEQECETHDDTPPSRRPDECHTCGEDLHLHNLHFNVYTGE
jgi:hypothetical protein